MASFVQPDVLEATPCDTVSVLMYKRMAARYEAREYYCSGPLYGVLVKRDWLSRIRSSIMTQLSPVGFREASKTDSQTAEQYVW